MRRTYAIVALTALALVSTRDTRAQDQPGTRAAGGWIADEAHVLTPDDIGQLSAVIDDVRNTQHVQLGILTVAVSDDDPKSLAVSTLNAWAPGPRSALLLLSMQPHRLYIQPGTELADTLDEHACSSICANVIAPRVREGDRGGALEAGLRAISKRIADGPDHTVAWTVLLVVLGGVAVVLLIVGLVWLARRKCENCGKRMKKSTVTLAPASYSSAGRGRATYACVCGNSATEIFTIAMLTQSTNDSWSSGSDSSSGGSSSSSDGSGGGGSSW